jgi:FKBP-type peptidyl-prolyl cis-trans isomerase 2
VGKLQTFLLSADEAFGQADGTAIQVMNRAEFPKELDIELNNGVEFNDFNGAFNPCAKASWIGK